MIPHDFWCVEHGRLAPIRAGRQTALERQMRCEREELPWSPYHMVIILVHHGRKQIRYVQIYIDEIRSVKGVNNNSREKPLYLFQCEPGSVRNQSI